MGFYGEQGRIYDGFGGAEEIEAALPAKLKDCIQHFETAALSVATMFHGERPDVLTGHGVYVFWDFAGVLYVGESWDIGRRIHDHMCSYPLPRQLAAAAIRVFAGYNGSVSAIETGHRKELEAHLIRELSPEFNIEGAERSEIANKWRAVNCEIISRGASIFSAIPSEHSLVLDSAQNHLTLQLLGGFAHCEPEMPRCWCEAVTRKLAISEKQASKSDERAFDKELSKFKAREAKRNAKKQEQGG